MITHHTNIITIVCNLHFVFSSILINWMKPHFTVLKPLLKPLQLYMYISNLKTLWIAATCHKTATYFCILWVAAMPVAGLTLLWFLSNPHWNKHHIFIPYFYFGHLIREWHGDEVAQNKAISIVSTFIEIQNMTKIDDGYNGAKSTPNNNCDFITPNIIDIHFHS